MIIAFVNQKGGVGKSTISGHLAAWLHKRGNKVLLIDADVQQSSSRWIQGAVVDLPTRALVSREEIIDQLPGFGETFEYVVVDSPGGVEVLNHILYFSDLALVLCGPSSFDLRTTDSVVKTLQRARAVRRSVDNKPDALFIANRIQVNTRLSRELVETAQGIGIPIARTAIRLRQVYADAPGQMTTVFSMGPRGKDAAEELDKLFMEVTNGRAKATPTQVFA